MEPSFEKVKKEFKLCKELENSANRNDASVTKIRIFETNCAKPSKKLQLCCNVGEVEMASWPIGINDKATLMLYWLLSAMSWKLRNGLA